MSEQELNTDMQRLMLLHEKQGKPASVSSKEDEGDQEHQSVISRFVLVITTLFRQKRVPERDFDQLMLQLENIDPMATDAEAKAQKEKKNQ
jgi:hypothetical protein